MSATNEREAIATLFKATWPSTVPVQWPNRKFTPPETGNWARMVIKAGGAFQLTMGGVSNWFRHPGILIVQCFTPLNVGDYKARQLADTAATIFRAKMAGITLGEEGMLFRTPTVRDIGIDGAWYQVNCEVEYYRDALY